MQLKKKDPDISVMHETTNNTWLVLRRDKKQPKLGRIIAECLEKADAEAVVGRCMCAAMISAVNEGMEGMFR